MEPSEEYSDDGPLFPEETKKQYLALLYLLFFSILMFTLPFLAFFGVRRYLENHFNLSVFEVNCWSVLAAVISVNFVIVLYVARAFKELKDEKIKNN